MKTTSIRNPLLALAAVGALLAFILACTSFSPDDSKVLYPTIDPESGAVGVAVYDREARRSETLLVPVAQNVEDLESGPVLLRAQWTTDGREIVLAWPRLGPDADIEEDGLNVAVFPVARDRPQRLFQVPALAGAGMALSYPMAIAGSSLFLVDSESGSVLRMDLRTGAMRRFDGMSELLLLPTSREDRLLYLGSQGETNGTQVGWMRTDTGARTVLFEVATLNTEPDGGFFAISQDGKRFASLDTSGSGPACRIQERGRPDKTLSLGPSAAGLRFGNALFSPDGDVVYLSIIAPKPETSGPSGGLGFLEIPIAGGPVRRTMLIEDLGDAGIDTVAYWQIGLSGDGRTLAVSSTYYALEPDVLTAADCALFLVDLSDPKRAVTKVPVSLPPRRGPSDK